MVLHVPDLDSKRPFYFDRLEGKSFSFTSEKSRNRIQINILMIFLKSGRQHWASEDYWTHVVVATGHLASVVDFNWSPAHISVSILQLPIDFIEIVVLYHIVILWSLRLMFAKFFRGVIIRKGNEPDFMPLFDFVLVSGSSPSMFHPFTEAHCRSFGAREGVIVRIYSWQCSLREFLCRNVGFGADGRDKMRSV